MDSRTFRSTVGLLLAACLSAAGRPDAGAARAEDLPAQLTIRGETHTIWPADDLRDLGYDVADIPTDQNAAGSYIEAINAFAELPAELEEAFTQALDVWPEGAAGKKLGAWITGKDNRRALELARRAARMDRCQFPYFGDPGDSVIMVIVPNLRHHRTLAKLLVVNGKRLESAGQYAQARADYQTACRIGGHVAQGITLIEALVGVACWNIGDLAGRELVLRHDLPADELEKTLRQANELAPLRPTVQRSMRMEKVFGLSVVDEFVTRPSRALANLGGLGCDWSGLERSVRSEHGWPALEARIGRLMFPDRTIKKQMSRFYDDMIRHAELPAYQARWNDGWDEEALLEIPTWNVLARIMLPAMGRANVLSERLRASTQMTQTVIALRLYAARHDGAVPERLDALADMFDDPDVLVDPLSGSQFVYRPQAEGWLLYSFGENLIDDDGREGDRPWELDYVIRYPAPDREESQD